MARQRPVERIPLKGEREYALMRRAGRAVALALQWVGGGVAPGMTTGELDAVAERTIREAGAEPAFLGYRGYPAATCISVNAEVVHGIPGQRKLRAGDVVSVDLGAVVEGWYADAARTFAVGEVSPLARRLMDAGQGALEVGIAAVQPGARVRDVGAAVQRYVEARGFSVVRDLCGHGIGSRLHEEPQVPNYLAPGGMLRLRTGMALAIEPMVNAGGAEVKLLADGWTFVTADSSLSVHYEHTVFIRKDGPEIITVLG